MYTRSAGIVPWPLIESIVRVTFTAWPMCIKEDYLATISPAERCMAEGKKYRAYDREARYTRLEAAGNKKTTSVSGRDATFPLVKLAVDDQRSGIHRVLPCFH